MHARSRIAAVFLISTISVAASAQDGDSTLHGTIIGPQGENVSYMWVRANAPNSGEAGRSESTVDGSYRISNLPAGSYTLEINTPCCAYLNFESDPIDLDEGETLDFEVRLEEGDSFNTIGDDPGVIAAALRSEANIPDLPPPRTEQGKPDFSGVWLIGRDPFPVDREALPWAEEILRERVANFGIDNPHLQCLPGGPPIPGGAAPFMAKFVQKPDLLIILFEDYPGFRQVFMDGREHPEDPNPSWVGHSIGQWDGDVLVIDTIGYNDRGWMSRYPRSEELHIIERYTRSEYGRIDLEMTVEDPKVFTKPWTSGTPFHLAPQEELIEYVCENNKWADASAN
ncbi:MAG: carboxypeptidase-like regulatory domain-containing protein [Bacteroidetes bacterium]|nr:carboxypeptidase-like regulatory domain-containing protein [Bacteroidota bacterium]